METKINKRLPTIKEWKWLINNCKWEWDTNLKGQEVTSENGNSIFLPAAGYRYIYDTDLCNVGIDGYYLSSSINMNYPNNAYAVLFYSDGVSRNNSNRYSRLSVRLVSDNPQEGFIDMGNGLYWAKENEPGLFTYDDAMKLYVKEKQDDQVEHNINSKILKNKSGYYKNGKFWKASTLWNATKDKIPQRVPNRYILQECTWNIGTLQQFANEIKNVQEVSLDYPIILDINGYILDGAHRVVKAYLEGKDIDIVYLGDDEWPEPDYDEEKAVKKNERK